MAETRHLLRDRPNRAGDANRRKRAKSSIRTLLARSADFRPVRPHLKFLTYEFASSIRSCLLRLRAWAFGGRCAAAPAEGPYHFLREISVGGEGGWDYLSIDAAGRRLIVSHGAQVVVIDIDHDTVSARFPSTGVHGMAVASELKRGFTSNGRENKASTSLTFRR